MVAYEAVVSRVKEHAYHLFRKQGFLCGEAVLISMNEAFQIGLSQEQALAMAAPFCEGLGQSGCLCGAVSGAMIACGLLLIKPNKRRRRKMARKIAQCLQMEFKNGHGSVCCRVLTKKVKGDKKAHLEHCAGLTVLAAETAARLVLEEQRIFRILPRLFQ